MPTETLFIDNKEIKIKTYILPHVNKLTVEEYAKIGGPRGWTDQQGFYVYRNNRLIVSGDWLLNNMQKKEQYKLARIRVDITNSMDEEWGIDVRKSIAVPPVAIQSEMKRIANIAQRESSKIYKHRGKKIARSINKEESFIWHQNIKYGKIGYKINRDHILIKTLIAGSQGKEIKKLLELIEETIPIPMIISDYSENSEKLRNPYEGKETDKYDEILENLFNLYIQNGFSPNESLSNIANSEPFIYMVEKIEIFKEKKGL